MPARTGPDDVINAALTCIARVGLAKTTLDDVAKEAGCARATVYRLFSGKQQLLAAAVDREAQRITTELVAHAVATESLADAVVDVITRSARVLSEHRALMFVVAHEPELLMPYLAFERESAVLGAAAQLIAPAFTPHLPRANATRLAEWVARMTFSYLCCPSEHVDVFDAAQVRSLVDDFVLPGHTQIAMEGIAQ
jgi:AcrR family transcriptional regulator